MNFSNNLRELRHKQKVSQEDFADFLGVDRKTYARWEDGESGVSSDYLPKIAEFLNVEIGELFKEKPGDIVVNQNDNKECLINAGVFLLINDKEAVDHIFDVIKKKVEKQ